MKKGTTVCSHGTPTDRDCLLCLQDMETPTLLVHDEVIEETKIKASTCLACKHSLAEVKCETLEISKRITLAFCKCPGCKMPYLMIVDVTSDTIFCYDVNEILGKL